MTATPPIATSHGRHRRPRRTLSTRLANLFRHTAPSRPVPPPDFEALRHALPVTDPARHDLENPAAEARFAGLAPRVRPASSLPDADTIQIALAETDAAFLRQHGPQQSWTPDEVDAYQQLIADIRRACTGGDLT
ncbi:hypothetical protein ACFWPV_10160 [Streptomyces uncialis]|uniref:hypothetical protein n=1 Tax=Streptomyces uncialis TaxID=1048205 RepID=UPI00365BCEF7